MHAIVEMKWYYHIAHSTTLKEQANNFFKKRFYFMIIEHISSLYKDTDSFGWNSGQHKHAA